MPLISPLATLRWPLSLDGVHGVHAAPAALLHRRGGNQRKAHRCGTAAARQGRDGTVGCRLHDPHADMPLLQACALTRISNDCCFSTPELSAIADADARLLSLCPGRACHMGGFAPHTALRSRSNGHAVATWLTRHDRRLLRSAFPVHRHHRCKGSGQQYG